MLATPPASSKAPPAPPKSTVPPDTLIVPLVLAVYVVTLAIEPSAISISAVEPSKVTVFTLLIAASANATVSTCTDPFKFWIVSTDSCIWPMLATPPASSKAPVVPPKSTVPPFMLSTPLPSLLAFKVATFVTVPSIISTVSATCTFVVWITPLALNWDAMMSIVCAAPVYMYESPDVRSPNFMFPFTFKSAVVRS